jgi:2-polyprenyl-3-methyl-5-hydroxy-6-metoxy-1,4-benzoquinol methylase
MDQDSASWRPVNLTRPWYQKALAIMPDLTNKVVLELGSGHGEFASIIQPQAKRLTCVDHSLTYVNQLKQAGFTAIKADLNHKLPLRSGQFDLIISLEVIEHLHQANAFLAETHRLLKPNGQLILSTPNISWWGYRLFSFLGQPPKKEGYHLRFFTYNTFRQLLSKAGFRIINQNSFTTIPLINRILPKPIYPTVKFWPNLLVQDLVFLCQRK